MVEIAPIKSLNQSLVKSPILLVGNFLSRAGSSRAVCEDLAEKLGRTGRQVLTTSNKPKRMARLVDMLSTVWRKRDKYAVAQVDVYSGAAFLWAEAVCLALRFAKKPYILTLHGGNLPSFAQRWPRRVQCLLNSASAVTAPSRYLFEQMSSYCVDMQLYPNPLDLRCYEFRLRRAVKPRLMWLRAFNQIYNPSMVAEVLEQLARDFPTIQATMIGGDKGDGSLQQAERVADEMGVAQRINFTGAIPKKDVARRLNEGDIFLNTSNIDNMPVSVLEAMASGLCIISTNVGGIPYLLEHEQDALLVPPGDSKAMSAAVRRLLTEEKLAERLSQNARQKAEQFDWAIALLQWESLLEAVVEGSRP